MAAPVPYIRLIRAFKEAGAVGEENAKTLDEIGMTLPTFMRKRLFNIPLKVQLSRERIFTCGDKYYLAEKYSKFPIEKLVEAIKREEQN